MATYIRLTEYKDSDSKEQGFFKSENRYEANQSDFEKIPGSPIAYWVSDRVIQSFKNSKKLEEFVNTRRGMDTNDNEKYLRYWFEVSLNQIDFNGDKSRWSLSNIGGDVS